MCEATRRFDAPTAGPIPDDLRIVTWIGTPDPDLEVERGDIETVGHVREVYHNLYMEGEGYDCWPALFATADGRVFVAEIGVIVRPATPDEVRDGVEAEKESVLDAAAARIAALDSYLKASEA